MTEEQLNRMTEREVYLRYYGILKKQVTQARQNRDIEYTIYCSVQPSDKRVEIWDFHPLPGDPSKKMRAKAKAKADAEELKRIKAQTAKAMDVFRSRGLIN